VKLTFKRGGVDMEYWSEYSLKKWLAPAPLFESWITFEEIMHKRRNYKYNLAQMIEVNSVSKFQSR